MISLSAQQAGKPAERDSEMEERITCFEQLVNNYLSGAAHRTQLDPLILNDDDLAYWMGQFEFTEEVLREISMEGFRNRLAGWAGAAEYNFFSSIEGMEKIEIAHKKFNYDDQPGLRVRISANLGIYLYAQGKVVQNLTLTLIDVRGQLKLIQAE
jgi:hypothetical protein